MVGDQETKKKVGLMNEETLMPKLISNFGGTTMEDYPIVSEVGPIKQGDLLEKLREAGGYENIKGLQLRIRVSKEALTALKKLGPCPMIPDEKDQRGSPRSWISAQAGD